MRRFVLAALCVLMTVVVSADQNVFRLRLLRSSAESGTPFNASWTVESTGKITMGLVAPEGTIAAGQGVQVGAFTTQTTFLNTWDDGSMRHGEVTFEPSSTGEFDLTVITNPGGSHTPTWPSADIEFIVSSGNGAGNTYTATLPSFTSTMCTDNGALMRRCVASVTPTTAGAVAHTGLQVFFEVTSYASGGHDVDLTWTNTKNVSTMDQVEAEVTITVAGSECFNKTFTTWTGNILGYRCLTGFTEAVVLHDFEPWKAAKVIPTIVASGTQTYDFEDDAFDCPGVPGSSPYFGSMDRNQGTSGGIDREDIQSINEWDGRLFALNTEHYRQASLRNGHCGGEWTMGITESDGFTLMPATDPDYDEQLTDHQSNSNLGNWSDHSSGFYWKGSRIGGNSDSWAYGKSTDVNNEHMAEMMFTPYLLTGKFYYLMGLRIHGDWAAKIALPSWGEADSIHFPGLMRGRNGTAALVSNSGVTREFATPFKNVARAAWAMPDWLPDDQAYLIEVTENNLEYLGYYADWWNDNGFGGDMKIFGFESLGAFNVRYNSVASTTAGNPTVITVIGDDSGLGTGINDHGGQTGDYVDLSGFVTSGATALNGTRRQITRINATQFSVAINTTSSTSGEGDWSRLTGFFIAVWRLDFTAYQAFWALNSGVFNPDAQAWDFVTRVVEMHVAINDSVGDVAFAAHPGLTFNYYPTWATLSGDTLNWFDTMAEVETYNKQQDASAGLAISEALYTAYGWSVHRGYHQWDNSCDVGSCYDAHADQMYRIGVKLGTPGASDALTRLLAVTGHNSNVSGHPGMNTKWDY